ncbi:unnamed protein product [Dovyalis caffra]|uniref:Uncharacterized protein n=1 Tax=Dovyalis caffra TaxID=77055 RepID=A0AAV1QR57_9ROSI|nr:unnamed protein product [Dovyalis caffra]
MGDLKTLAKARMELEELYSGIPDDSVNLTFQDLAMHVKQNTSSTSEKINTTTTTTTKMEPLREAQNPKQVSNLIKLPSLDFSRGLQASKNHHQPHHPDHIVEGHPFDQSHKHFLHDGHPPYGHGDQYHDQSHLGHANMGRKSPPKSRFAPERNKEYDDVSVLSMNSMYQERSGRPRRPGIPHSNICLWKSLLQELCKHRNGRDDRRKKMHRVFGETFQPKAELKWAEKGPRKAGERAFGHSTMTSRSRSPITPRTPRTPNKAAGAASMNQDLPSFVASSPFSPYNPYTS